MIHEFSQEDIENTKDSIESLQKRLIDKYLNEHCSSVEEKIHGYDNCCKYKKVNTNQQYQEAIEQTEIVIKKVIKQLGYLF